MKAVLADLVRDAGYEVLFQLGGFLGLAVHPTQGNLERIERWIEESQARRENLRKLEKRGLVESGVGKEGQWVPRLTELGRVAFAGGRHPEEAWNRLWDGNWRLLTFDLPRQETSARMKLRRWLCANHFGRLQGSVWITPDPVDDVGKLVVGDTIDPSMVMAFEGGLVGGQEPREVAVMAWDFGAINEEYRRYSEATSRVLKQVQRKSPPLSGLRRILDEDRKGWWAAVQLDPLLPKALLPRGYAGTAAWKVRCKLLRKLGKNLDVMASP